MDKPIKNCAHCGAPFVPKTSRSTCCSKNCQRLRWYYANHEHANATTRAWQKRNVARWYAKKAAWGKANAAHKAEMYRAWIAKNPDAAATYLQNRLDRMVSNLGSVGISDRDWNRALNRARGKCYYCDEKSDRLEMDHVLPLSRGGRHAIGNVVPACHDCNMFKRAHTLMEWRRLQLALVA